MTEDELRDLEERRLRALVAADIETARDLHADEYELITPGGATLSKADYLDAIGSGAMRYLAFQSDSPVRVRMNPMGGVVRYVARIEMEVDGERYSGRYWHTDVWEERDGRWQAAWSQATRLPQPELDPAGEILTEAELARRAGTTPERIRHLVSIGVLRPSSQGLLAPADLQRTQIVDAYERGGVELAHLEQAIREGRMTFDFTDRIYPVASSPSGHTIADLAAELGPVGAVLPDLFLALGRPRPEPDRSLTEADERVLRAFVAAWSSPALGGQPLMRAARLLGDSTRRVAEGWVNLFIDALTLTPEVGRTMSVDELRPRMLEPAADVAQALEPAVTWLLAYHMEQALNVVNIESMERALEAEGIRPRVDRSPPAVVFADMSGFTRLTEEHGDELAVGHAESLAGLAIEAVADLRGRLVKQLGDGVMLVFDRAPAAVQATHRLMTLARDAGLPELHVGISAGPLIERDGDYFGRTVNLASRLSGVAGPGEVVLNEAAAQAAGTAVVALGPTVLKGLPAPVPAFRLEEATPPKPRD